MPVWVEVEKFFKVSYREGESSGWRWYANTHKDIRVTSYTAEIYSLEGSTAGRGWMETLTSSVAFIRLKKPCWVLCLQFTLCDICVDTSCSSDTWRMVFVLSASILRLVHISIKRSHYPEGCHQFYTKFNFLKNPHLPCQVCTPCFLLSTLGIWISPTLKTALVVGLSSGVFHDLGQNIYIFWKFSLLQRIFLLIWFLVSVSPRWQW